MSRQLEHYFWWVVEECFNSQWGEGKTVTWSSDILCSCCYSTYAYTSTLTGGGGYLADFIYWVFEINVYSIDLHQSELRIVTASKNVTNLSKLLCSPWLLISGEVTAKVLGVGFSFTCHIRAISSLFRISVNISDFAIAISAQNLLHAGKLSSLIYFHAGKFWCDSIQCRSNMGQIFHMIKYSKLKFEYNFF